MQNDSSDLKSAIIVVFRESLAERYAVKNIRRFSECDAMSEALIRRVSDFFMEHIYPTAERRGELDGALESLGSVLRSPRKLWPLTGTALSSIWKMKTMLPAAMGAGFRALESFVEMRKLEKRMIGYAARNQLSRAELEDELTFARLIAALPRRNIMDFQRDILRFFDSLARNMKLLEASVEILDHSKGVMLSKPGYYEPRDLAGLAFGRKLLQGGLELFRELRPGEAALIMRGIELVETDWYDRMVVLAGGKITGE